MKTAFKISVPSNANASVAIEASVGELISVRDQLTKLARDSGANYFPYPLSTVYASIRDAVDHAEREYTVLKNEPEAKP